MKNTKNDFALEVAYALKDMFEATIEVKEDNVILSFVDGKKFTLSIEE